MHVYINNISPTLPTRVLYTLTPKIKKARPTPFFTTRYQIPPSKGQVKVKPSFRSVIYTVSEILTHNWLFISYHLIERKSQLVAISSGERTDKVSSFSCYSSMCFCDGEIIYMCAL